MRRRRTLALTATEALLVGACAAGASTTGSADDRSTVDIRCASTGLRHASVPTIGRRCVMGRGRGDDEPTGATPAGLRSLRPDYPPRPDHPRRAASVAATPERGGGT